MKVEPITEIKHIKAIKKMLKDNPRDSLLFIMGINSGLRMQDLLQLKISHVLNIQIGDRVQVKELKTGKENIILVNQEIYSAIQLYLQSGEHKETDYLFKSRKGENYPLTVFRTMHMIKSWTSALKLKGNFGAHTLRKTFCYMQRTQFGASWEVLAKRLNHSSPSITRRYMGVQDEEVEEILLHNI